MKLQIKNLGPIKKGEIDLTKRFYVFVGYNNSGKTYVSQLLWSLWGKNKRDIFRKKLTNKLEELTDINGKELPQEITISKEIIKTILEKYGEYLLLEFKNNMNSMTDDFLNKSSLSFDTNFEKITKEKFEHSIKFIDKGVILKKDANSTLVRIEPMSKVLFDNYNVLALDQFDMATLTSKNIACLDNGFLADFLLQVYFKNSFSTPFFLPANRLFYPNFYKYIYSASKEEKERINKIISSGETSTDKIKHLSKTPYTKSMDVLTEEIFRLSSNGQLEEKGLYNDLILELEKIIGGQIIMKRIEGISPIEFYFKTKNGKELDMHVSSSSINQLATLYLYFKYWAKADNNFLIIDEPEENLHPQNQIILLDILMKFANKNNNRVLMTTHSSLMTDAVNNHLHLGALKKKGLDIKKIIKENDLNIDANAALDHEDIGIYFFDGKKIINYEVEEYGAYFRDFKKEERQVRDNANILKGIISDINNQKRKKQFEKKNNA